MFNAPIPGQSLTTPPKQYAWERPPEMDDPEEVIQFYIRKMNNPDTMEGIIDALELDMTVKDLTEGMLRMGVANGLHSIDVSLLAAPVIHDFIVSFAKDLGVEYDEGWEDKKQVEKDRKAKTYIKTKKRMEKLMQKGSFKETPKASATTTENYEEEGDLMEPEVMKEEAPKGFIARRK